MTQSNAGLCMGRPVPRARRYLDDIIHIQIERSGLLQFGSYDNFHRECVVCYTGVETSLLNRHKSSGVIRSWQVVPCGRGPG